MTIFCDIMILQIQASRCNGMNETANEIKRLVSEPSVRLLARENNVDMETGYLLRAVYGKTERFTTHCHDFYELFLTVAGNIKHYVNGELTSLDEGTLVLIRPNDTHGYICEGEDYSFVNLALERELFENMLVYAEGIFDKSKILEPTTPPTAKLTEFECDTVLKKFNGLNMIPTTDKHTAMVKIRMLLLDVFTEFFCKEERRESIYAPSWLEETLLLMTTPENFTVGIDRMTELSGKTREHLSRSVKKYTGKTLTEYINDLRINYAAHLLKNTNHSITRICFDSGFGNMSRFYSYFNKTYGVSPLIYRKNK